jgi:hypothetical protein
MRLLSERCGALKSLRAICLTVIESPERVFRVRQVRRLRSAERLSTRLYNRAGLPGA